MSSLELASKVGDSAADFSGTDYPGMRDMFLALERYKLSNYLVKES
ncbi:hypothetical protein Daudx_0720 [Candidatus Desulforudis audaxviator]|nr:hypothetical protein Daudx_0720 [Candidatus Desulforudis audaxviator]